MLSPQVLRWLTCPEKCCGPECESRELAPGRRGRAAPLGDKGQCCLV